MKKSMRLFLTGSVQSLFFEQFVKNHADEHKVKGFLRKREDGRIEIFLEGDKQKVDILTEICKHGPKYAHIRNVEEQPEPFQGFTEFKILKI